MDWAIEDLVLTSTGASLLTKPTNYLQSVSNTYKQLAQRVTVPVNTSTLPWYVRVAWSIKDVTLHMSQKRPQTFK